MTWRIEAAHKKSKPRKWRQPYKLMIFSKMIINSRIKMTTKHKDNLQNQEYLKNENDVHSKTAYCWIVHGSWNIQLCCIFLPNISNEINFVGFPVTSLLIYNFYLYFKISVFVSEELKSFHEYRLFLVQNSIKDYR